MHHWSYPEINDTDTDDLLAYISYYPEWKKRFSGSGDVAQEDAIRKVYVDQVDYL